MPRRLARKIAPPPPPARRATRLLPPNQRDGGNFSREGLPRGAATTGDPDRDDELLARNRATRDIGLRSRTGRATARGLTDVRPVDMIPMGSSVSPNPRVREAGYDDVNQIVRVTFRDGTPWAYYNVPPEVWTEFRSADSPGRYINEVLNGYPYGYDVSRPPRPVR